MIRFIDCISEGSHSELKPLSAFDHYFSYSGREYCVLNPLSLQEMPAFEVERVQSEPNYLLTVLKVISLFTLIVPLIMLIGKLICRSQYAFYLQGSHLKGSADENATVANHAGKTEYEKSIQEKKDVAFQAEESVFPSSDATVGINNKDELSDDDKDKIDQAKELIQTFGNKSENANDVDKILALGFKDQAGLIEVVKFYAEKNVWPVVLHIQKFGITDQTALLEIAMICAEKKTLAIAEYIKNFGITDQTALIKVARTCVKKDIFATASNIKKFGISDQAALIEIAKVCAEKQPWYFVDYVKDFGIRDPAVLVELFKICMKQLPVKQQEFYKGNFGIADTKVKSEILPEAPAKIDQAKEWVNNYNVYTLGDIHALGIEDQAELVEVIKLCAEKDPEHVAEYIKCYNISDVKDRVQIARICMKKCPGMTTAYLENFEIVDQKDLIDLAKLCAERDSGSLATFVKKFGIKDQKVLIDLAKFCAEKDVVNLNTFIKNFGIEDQAALTELAKFCAEENPMSLAYCIGNFGIEDPAVLLELAKICMEKIPDEMPQYLKSFGITDQSVLV